LLANPDFSKMELVKAYTQTIVAPAIDYWIKTIDIKKGDEVARLPCVCVCVCVSSNHFALVLSLCCSTGVRGGALGSESTMYTVVVDYWKNFEWFVTRIESFIWSLLH